ncbi:M20 aminoacylase family protein [Arcobacter sp.]|uniref:M20 aminoacylase family protein n=1 Tax=unclassified Arcobacter TaxID=2593671 RepID=UPI003AFF7835|eukprot:TRINITY_DN2468_c0_g1_i5.p1 TRINITY_DN2468_c0_g1~~TRINITY_DN2468_c0_g1_i5.p1  ORF type:complete len:384 (+),score=-53.86 TRINITY_DN2468_c0_g1_i5:489-1640(+)
MEKLTSKSFISEVTSWRHHIHNNPETAFEEVNTADFLALKLESFGLDVHRGLAKTGIVATLNKDSSGKSIALRADMDALDIKEETCLSYSSKNSNKMHACGHDGHMAMLLGAAKLLCEDSSFKGKVHFIFQPAEENVAGGRVMIAEGLFDIVDCEEIYGMHNWPGIPVGEIGVKVGPIMASNDNFIIKLNGASGHAALPHLSNDVISGGCSLVTSLNQLVSRIQDTQLPTVLSVTKIEAGSAFNILPEEILIWGTVRTFDKNSQDLIEKNIEKSIKSICLEYDLTYTFEYNRCYVPTINHEKQTEFSKKIIKKVTQKEATTVLPSMAAEDFGYMLEEKPGCLVWLGNGENSKSLHNAKYDFNDDALSYGIKYWVELAKEYFQK